MAQVAVVTGASSGIGKEVAKALAAAGWRVIALGRDPARSEAAGAEIRAASSGEGVDFLRADLSLVADARRVADEIAALTDRIDLLVDNAGGTTAERHITAEGHELAFAANHLGPFVLTGRLLPILTATAAGKPAGSVRIIVTSSAAHEHSPGFDWDDIQAIADFDAGRAYMNAKLANLLFARSLARRLAGAGIVANAVHPGIVDSNFASHGSAAMQAYFKTKPLATAAEGADTILWLATSDDGGRVTGGYFHERQDIGGTEMSRDPALADRLWAETEAIVARTGAGS